MARRFSSIRTWLIMLILVPLTSLAGLWAFATATTYGDARQLQQSNQFQEKSLLPTQRLIEALQKERRLSVGRLAGARSATPAALAAQRRATDQIRTAARRHASDRRLRNAIDRQVVRRIDAFLARLDALGQIRAGVDARTTDRARALEEYSGLVDAAFAIYASVAPADARIAAQAGRLITLARAREFLSREDALVAGATGGGHLTAAERAQFAQLVGAQRHMYADNTGGLPADQAERLRNLFAAPEAVQLRRFEEQIVRGADPVESRAPQGRAGENRGGRAGTGPAGANRPGTGQGGTGQNGGGTPAVDAAAWRVTADTVTARLFAFENAALEHLTTWASDIAFGVVRRLALAAGVGLLAIIFSVVVAVRVSRRVLGESKTLARGVGDFTRRTLPQLAERARDGRPIDDIEDVPDQEYRISEIREISESFRRARDAVLAAAARELEVRNGLSEVFVNLARRNQALLHRQLSLLDTMERRTEDPNELSDLFRLDHLATRMRRHAEGLVILAGKSAGRGWRRPVPLVDVVRGAVAEVEDYPRVRVQPLPRVALQGTAVADVIHMLAEIVENATTYSPPQSPVRVSGHTVANGLVVEVEDRGLGMTEHDMAVANERLAEPPEFDPADSARLGLFVVARLARRHGITVTLRPSPYGGTTAIALIPNSLITDVPEQEQGGRRGTTGPMALPEPAGVAARGAGAARSGGSGPVRLVPGGSGGGAGEDAAGRTLSPAPPTSPADPSASALRSTEQNPTTTEHTSTAEHPTSAERAETARSAESAPAAEPAETAGSATPGESGEHARGETAGGGPAAGEPSRSGPPQEQPLAEGGLLPRRKKQTHLAPQLKERVDAELAAERRRRAAPPPLPGQVPPPAPEGAQEPAVPLAAPVAPADPAPAAPNAADPPTAGGPRGHDQVHDVPDGPGVPDPGGPDPGTEPPRTPEEMRSIMSSMQRGWERGRSESGRSAQAGRSRTEEDDTR